MTRFRNAPLGRALIGLGLGATLFVAHLLGLFRAGDRAVLAALASWAPPRLLAGTGLRDAPEELYGSALVLLAVVLMLGLGGRSLRGKLSAAFTAALGSLGVSVGCLVWGHTLVPLWPALTAVAASFVVAVCLELAEAGYVIEREVRAQPGPAAGSGEPEEPSPARQAEEALKSIVGWHELPAAALLFGGPLRPSRVAIAVGDGPVRWLRAPSLRALGARALRTRAPVLGKWPSRLDQGGEWHALAVPVAGWAGQAAALILASPRLPIPHDALDFGTKTARQLLAARTLASEINLVGRTPRRRPSDLPLPRRLGSLWSARAGQQWQAAVAAAWRSAAHEAVVLFDLAGRPAMWNREAELLFGADRDGLARGHLVPLLAGASGLSPEHVRQAATEVLLHGAPFICDLEDPAERHNYVATLSQVAVCGETPGGLVIRAVDVTGVCRPARVEARLMGVAAHEMRTPLTSILGYSELLVEHTDRGEPVHRYAAAVHRQAQRLEAIVEELLAVTRLEAGREALTLEPVDMAAVVRHVVLSARPMARDHGVAVTVHAETGRAVVRGDALKLERVVANLVTNAIKYGGPGASVRVTVERNGDRVLVAVADTGCGISEQDAPHVFEKFYRARSPQALAVPGTGLGLAIVKLIVEAHEGDTALHTVVGAGSTFTVSLPVSGPRRHEASTAA